MYALFTGLDRALRQALYDEYCALPRGPDWHGRGWRVLDGQSCCPAGYVNARLGREAYLLPDDYQHLTPTFRALTTADDLDRFIADWDADRIASLAAAMGVTGDY